MNGRPEPPPWGVLIEKHRRQGRLSIREAARRAGISEGWWRQVVKGYQTLSGGDFGKVRGPAETVAIMAAAVGTVTAEQLAGEGEREDAAAELGKILRDRARQQQQKPPSAPGSALDYLLAPPGGDEMVLDAYIVSVRRDLKTAIGGHGAGFSGHDAFDDGTPFGQVEVATWEDTAIPDANVRERLIALLRYHRVQAGHAIRRHPELTEEGLRVVRDRSG